MASASQALLQRVKRNVIELDAGATRHVAMIAQNNRLKSFWCKRHAGCRVADQACICAAHATGNRAACLAMRGGETLKKSGVVISLKKAHASSTVGKSTRLPNNPTNVVLAKSTP
jgi:hypothetical protein